MVKDEQKVIFEKIRIKNKKSSGKYLKKYLLNFTISALRCGDIIEKKMSDYPAYRAFVTFLYPAQRLEVLRKYLISKKMKQVVGKVTPSPRDQESQPQDPFRVFKLNGKDMDIVPAEEPLSINFNSLGLTTQQKIIKNVIGVAKAIFLMILFFFFLLFLRVIINIPVLPCESEREYYAQIISDKEKQTDWHFINCFCGSNYADENLGK